MHMIDDIKAPPRTRAIVAAAAIAAIGVNAGAVWVYRDLTGPDSRVLVEMTFNARSSLDVRLQPGKTGDLIVTVTNDNAFPVHFTSVRPGPGNVIADDEHRDHGCERTGVSFSRQNTPVDWAVSRNNVVAFTVPGALVMGTDAEVACWGAVFTVPVRVAGDTNG